MSLRSLLPLVALLVLAPGEAAAQAPLVLEARGGAFVPLGGFRDGVEGEGGFSAGGSFGVGFSLERSDGWHLQVGFSQHRIGAGGRSHVATAWELGARLDLGSGFAVPWVRAGLTLPRVELAADGERHEGVTGLGIGGEVGTGVRFSVGGRFHLQPGIRFGAVDTGLPDGPTLRMRYLVPELAVVVGF